MTVKPFSWDVRPGRRIGDEKNGCTDLLHDARKDVRARERVEALEVAIAGLAESKEVVVLGQLA